MLDPYTGEILVMIARNPFTYDAAALSDESSLRCEDPSLAVQSSRDEADINTIVRRFGLTGQLPQDVVAPVYGDFTGIGDFQSALNAVLAAEAAFGKMPADVRSRFRNDAGLFVDFCSDERNREEATKLGLLVPVKAPPLPIEVRVVPEVPPVVKV